MKGKSLIYLALGGLAVYLYARHKKEQSEVPPVEERTLVLLELGFKNGDKTPARLTYSDGTKEIKVYNSAEVLAATRYAEQVNAEIKTDVKSVLVMIDDGLLPKL